MSQKKIVSSQSKNKKKEKNSTAILVTFSKV